MNGTAQCPHPDYEFHFNITKFTDTNIQYFEIQGRCKVCHGKMKFRGMPIGVMPEYPTVNPTAQHAHLPFMIEDEEYDGKSIGFGVDFGKEIK